jgi:outer membrane protein assembly factor BamB
MPARIQASIPVTRTTASRPRFFPIGLTLCAVTVIALHSMSGRLRWLVVAPVVLFVAVTLLMSSCGGGGGGCEGSYDEFGNFVAGLCPSPGAEPGFNLETIVIGAGTPLPSTPTPSPTPTGGHVKSPTPTATQTLVPQAGPTTAVMGQQVPFNASGLFVKGAKMYVADITNRSSTLWTSSDKNVLAPPAPPPMGGIYSALTPGCACADASSGGVSADPVSVGVVANASQPTPVCPLCPTAAPTATPTGHAAATAQIPPAQSDTARINGVLQWTFQGVSPIASRLAPASDGNLYFLTLDGNLHALNGKGRERWSRRAAGKSIAVSPGAVVYALGSDGALQALSAIGKPLWNMSAGSGFGPLAASSSAVYFQEDRTLAAASSPGVVQWRAAAPDEITSAAIADDGTIIAAANGASVIAIASDGSRRWSFAPQGGFAGEIAVRGNRVYLGSGSGRLYALDASNGAAQWTYDSAAAVAAGPVLNAAGPIFFGSDAVYALNSDGSLAWSKTLATGVSSPLAADREGGVLAPLDDDIAAMLNSDGSLKWATRSFGPVERATVSPSGVLYVATRGTIYAVK